MVTKKENVFNKLCTSSEEQWIRFQHESGHTVEEIVENVNREIGGIGPDGKHTRIGVEYILGMKVDEDIKYILGD